MNEQKNNGGSSGSMLTFLFIWGAMVISILSVLNCALRKCRTLPQVADDEDLEQEEDLEPRGLSCDKRRAIFEKMLENKRVSIGGTNKTVCTLCSGEEGYSSEGTDKASQVEEKKVAGVLDICAHNLRDDESGCLICMSEYEDRDEVTSGNLCDHIFHKKCILDWLEKHNHCPICRQNMMTSDELKVAATLLDRISKSKMKVIKNELVIDHSTPDLESGLGHEDRQN